MNNKTSNQERENPIWEQFYLEWNVLLAIVLGMKETSWWYSVLVLFRLLLLGPRGTLKIYWGSLRTSVYVDYICQYLLNDNWEWKWRKHLNIYILFYLEMITPLHITINNLLLWKMTVF